MLFCSSTTPEPSDHCLRKRFKESKPLRRKQPRERKGKRSEIVTEESIENSNPASTVDSTNPEPSSSNGNVDNIDTEDASGFNSEDEYASSIRSLKDQHLTDEEWTAVYITCTIKKTSLKLNSFFSRETNILRGALQN